MAERPCPPKVDIFDLEKSSAIQLEEVLTMLSMKKNDLDAFFKFFNCKVLTSFFEDLVFIPERLIPSA